MSQQSCFICGMYEGIFTGGCRCSTELKSSVNEVLKELTHILNSWPPFNSAHEGYGIMSEEFKELSDWVFTNQKKRNLVAMKKEAIQVAAVAIRFASEVCNEERGRK